MLMLKDGILIETKRLLFRPWADSDAEVLFNQNNKLIIKH